MCETSNTPAPVRTATCSWRMPSYCTGISQPANGTRRAPARSWRSNSGVRRRVSAAGGNRPQVTPWGSRRDPQRGLAGLPRDRAQLAGAERLQDPERLGGVTADARVRDARVPDDSPGVDDEGRAQRRAVVVVEHAVEAGELLRGVGDHWIVDPGEARARLEPGAVHVPGVGARGHDRGVLDGEVGLHLRKPAQLGRADE